MRCIEGRRWLVLRAAGAAALAVLGLAAAGCGHAQEPGGAGGAGGARGARGADQPWQAYQRRAAERLVAANAGQTYMGEVPAELFGIPVLEVHLARDGSVRRIVVKRSPANPAARDTVKIAIEAVRRGAPYGDLSALPAPWIWTEVFLFNEKRQFKPRTLDD